MAKKGKTGPAETPEKPKESLMEFIGSMAVVFVTGLFIVTFNLQAFEIPSASMKDTLLIGDHLFVDRTTVAPPSHWLGPLLPYHKVERGDIVVFISPIQPGLHVVKRIIGVPGDRIHLKGGVLFRNGEKVFEAYMIPPREYSPYRDDFPSVSPEFAGNVSPEWNVTMASYIQNGDLVVPPGRYFAMGDNREVSLDSRYWGFLPRENIVGRPLFVYWSFETPEDQYTHTELKERVAWLLHVVFNFFSDTKWRRTLRFVH